MDDKVPIHEQYAEHIRMLEAQDEAAGGNHAKRLRNFVFEQDQQTKEECERKDGRIKWISLLRRSWLRQ